MDTEPLVLIADDDQDVVELLKVYLRPLNCRTITARDGEEALSKAQGELPNIVLLDVSMPKRSGWEVCQALKAVQKTANICVVLITGRGDVKDRLTGLQVGADDYLVKPLQREEVTSRVGKLVENVRAGVSIAPSFEQAQGAANLLFDRATDLPTIPLVLSRVKEVLIDHGSLGILYVDIEQFESIEVEYGWAFFEEFLKNVGGVVRDEAKFRFRGGIATAAGVAGSSFYIFVEATGRQTDDAVDGWAQALRERLIGALRTRFPKMHSEQIGFFVGSTVIEYQPQIRLERQIYQGMRRAADAVRTAEQNRKKQLTQELREIIRRKRITTVFQPIVRSLDGSIFGYEILTRGPSNSSFTNSDMLFSFAREANVAWDLEALALENALRVLRSADLGEKKFLFNLEAEMFEMSELKVHEIVAFFNERRGHFVFELTERAAIEDYAVFRERLEEFRLKGVEIAIDDAGSGYASLEAIASLAPDYLKVTKGLVSTLAQEPIKQDLLKLLVELAHKTNSKTIAEGIETEEEYDWCRKLGIDLMQGYYIAMPQEALVDEVTLSEK